LIRAWRIVKSIYKDSAFNGDGARLYGGRWNNPGHPAVYVASSQALAVLGIMANGLTIEDAESFVLISVDFPKAFVQDISTADLSPNWTISPAPESTMIIGDRWIASGSSVALKVPSVIVPDECNYLLNPQHPDFASLVIGSFRHFKIDSRLFT
jgi:RES domain-containing protein